MASCQEKFQKQLLQKEVKYDEEVNLLKADMLVDIQVARSGNTSSNGGSQPDSQTVASTITRAGMKLSLEVCVSVCFLCVCALEKLCATEREDRRSMLMAKG